MTTVPVRLPDDAIPHVALHDNGDLTLRLGVIDVTVPACTEPMFFARYAAARREAGRGHVQHPQPPKQWDVTGRQW